jgi:glycosyltransferase involved in cell wall biosynthesis
MRILFIGDISNIHVIRWVRYMVGRGYEVVILSTRRGEVPGARVIHLDPGDKPGRRWIKILRHLWFIINEWLIIKFGRFDIVNVHFLRADMIGWIATLHPRTVITVYGSDMRPVAEGGDPRRLGWKRSALCRAAAITAVNPFLEDKVRAMAPDVKKTEIIPFGVDLSRFNRRGWKPGGTDQIRFCLVKLALDGVYGPDIAIQAMARVVRQYPAATLTLVGDGDEKYVLELRALVNRLNLQSAVNFIRRVEHEKLARIFEQNDVVLQPSRWESFGVVILEAAAVGLPAIASRVGGVPDLIIEGVTGLTFPPEDVEALAEAMIKLTADPALRNQMGRNAHDLARKLYSFDMHAGRMEELYAQLLEDKAR